MSTNPSELLARTAATGTAAAGLPTATGSATARPTSLKTLDSHELLQGADQIVITHGEHEYRLRVTRNQKLILHK